MEIKELISGRIGCECGKDHICPIESVVIGEKAFDCLPALVEKYSNILVVADRNTYAVCGEAVEKKLASRRADTLIYSTESVLVPNETAIAELKAHVTDEFETHHDNAKFEENIRRIYGSVADEVIALQRKLGWYDVDRISVYRDKWKQIKDILADCPTSAQMLALIEKIGLSYDKFVGLYGDEKIDDAILYAKDLKDRYSVLWMYYDLFN